MIPTQHNTELGISWFDLQRFAEEVPTDPPTDPTPPTPPADPPATDPPKNDPPPTDPPTDPKANSLLGNKPDSTVPEAYEEFKLPENVQWDATTGEEFKSIAKEMGLSQENAQKLVDLGAKMVSGQEESMGKMIADQSTAWQKESLQQFKQADIDIANKAIMQFADTDTIELLQTTGLGNNPLIVGLFNKIGQAMQEGNMPLGANQQTPTRLYPNSGDMYK